MLHLDFETWAVKYMLCYLVFQTIRMGPNTLAINPTWPDEGGPMNNTNYSNSSLPIPTNNYVQISSTSSSTGTMGVNTSVVSSNNSSCSRPSGATTAGWSMARLLWRKIYLKYKLLCHFEISTPFFLLTSIFCGIFYLMKWETFQFAQSALPIQMDMLFEMNDGFVEAMKLIGFSKWIGN